VGLFTGYMGSLLDLGTVIAAIKALTASVFNVSLTEQQTATALWIYMTVTEKLLICRDAIERISASEF